MKKSILFLSIFSLIAIACCSDDHEGATSTAFHWVDSVGQLSCQGNSIQQYHKGTSSITAKQDPQLSIEDLQESKIGKGLFQITSEVFPSENLDARDAVFIFPCYKDHHDYFNTDDGQITSTDSNPCANPVYDSGNEKWTIYFAVLYCT